MAGAGRWARVDVLTALMETTHIILDPARFRIISYLHTACCKCDCRICTYAIYRSGRNVRRDTGDTSVWDSALHSLVPFLHRQCV